MSTFFGYWPLFGGEVILHAIFAVLGAYFGFALPVKAKQQSLDREYQIKRAS